jgi:hypothetical protein
MKTTLVSRSSESSSRFAATSWPAISAAVSWRSHPSRAVAQKRQPIAHPACDEMQTVSRGGSGMMTLSIAAPSASWNKSFRVPSAERLTCGSGSSGRSKAASSEVRSARPTFVMSAKLAAPR